MGEEKIQNEEFLDVKMFGSFSIGYKGKSLFGRKSGETQFAWLMQILIHNRENGVSREEVEEILFGDRDMENVHHALQSVIYNAKKKLEKAGLPQVNYIILKDGNLYWTKEIPVQEDATLFEELCRSAEDTEDIDEKLEYLQKACVVYTGEFLPFQAGVLWAASEARRYRGMFCKCVETLAEILTEKADYVQLERLGKYAAKIAPFSDWETLSMEALVRMGRYEEAASLYAETVDRYFEERGVYPSDKMLESLNSLGDQIVHSYEILDNIQSKLNEEGEADGAYMCSYPTFRGIYQLLVRLLERSGQSIYLMLCTIVDSKGNPMKDGAQLDSLSERLGDAICHSIRHSDIVNRYSKGQYLVLLINTTRENCNTVQKRINYRFLTGRQRTGVQYYVNSVITEQTF